MESQCSVMLLVHNGAACVYSFRFNEPNNSPTRNRQ